MAAASVTRTASSAKTRSNGWDTDDLRFFFVESSKIFAKAPRSHMKCVQEAYPALDFGSVLAPGVKPGKGDA